jgi:hypothetical protein
MFLPCDLLRPTCEMTEESCVRVHSSNKGRVVGLTRVCHRTVVDTGCLVSQAEDAHVLPAKSGEAATESSKVR